MSECLKREVLLAFADRELPAAEMKLVERHIADCTACKAQFDSVRSTALRVDSLLGALMPDDAVDSQPSVLVSIPQRAAGIRTRWAAVGSIGVLAAAAILWFLAARGSRPAPEVRSTVIVPVVQPHAVEAASPAVVNVSKVAGNPARNHRNPPRQFRALDNGGPIETGMIYRVSLPGSSDSAKRIPAEVIVDDFGKVRAIRFLQ